MSPISLQWSERNQVVAVILAAGVLLFALWFFTLIPLSQGRRRLEREIEHMRRQLESKNYLVGESVLRQKKLNAEQYNRRLNKEWEDIADHVAAFDIPEADVKKIDFKVELFDVRHRLLKKSREMRVSLPHDFGMDAEVRSNVDARKLMLQLRTVEKLVDLALDLKIDMLRSIVPLPPIAHAAGPNEEVFMEEYPVKLEVFASHENLYDLFRASLATDHVFAMRRLQVSPTAGDRRQLLCIRTTMSAFVFMRNPEDLKLASSEPIKTGPKGF